MKPIKIYGESKTGTTYLQHLLELNIDAEIIGGGVQERLGWKHGFPQHGDVTYIFIFRDLYEWAKSLIVSQKDKRFNGLRNQFGSTENYFWNVWNNPIECRTAKYYSYLGFRELHDCVLVSYEYLRNNPEQVMWVIGDDFDKDSFKDVETHVYYESDTRDNPKRRDLEPSEIRFIDAQKDPALEEFVTNLTIE